MLHIDQPCPWCLHRSVFTPSVTDRRGLWVQSERPACGLISRVANRDRIGGERGTTVKRMISSSAWQHLLSVTIQPPYAQSGHVLLFPVYRILQLRSYELMAWFYRYREGTNTNKGYGVLFSTELPVQHIRQ